MYGVSLLLRGQQLYVWGSAAVAAAVSAAGATGRAAAGGGKGKRCLKSRATAEEQKEKREKGLREQLTTGKQQLLRRAVSPCREMKEEKKCQRKRNKKTL